MTELVIICDGCGYRSNPTRNAGMKIGTIRGELRMAGWDTDDRRGKDFCPDCRKKRKVTSPTNLEAKHD